MEPATWDKVKKIVVSFWIENREKRKKRIRTDDRKLKKMKMKILAVASGRG